MTPLLSRRLMLAGVFVGAVIVVAVGNIGSNGGSKQGTCENNSAENSQTLEFWNHVLAKDHANGPAYLSRGRCWYYLHDYHRALPDLNEAIRLDSKSAEAFLYRARTTRMLGQIQQALADYSRSIQIKPSAEAYMGRGGTLQDEFTTEEEQAFADFNAALKLDRKLLAAYKYRAGVYEDRGQYHLAEADLKAWLDLAPDTPEPYCHMGLLRLYEGKDADGQQWFKTCFEKDPSPQNQQYYDHQVRNVYAARQSMTRRSSGNTAAYDDYGARQKHALDVLERSGNEAGARACRNDSSNC